MTQATAGLGIKDLRDRHGWIAPLLLFVAALAAIVGSLCVGAYPMSFGAPERSSRISPGPSHCPTIPTWSIKEITVVADHPPAARAARGGLAGTGARHVGAALQGMMRNPLVGPDLVGVTSGAAFGGVLAMLRRICPPAGIIACALWRRARRHGDDLLARQAWCAAEPSGQDSARCRVFIGAFLACVGLVRSLAPDAKLPTIVYWTARQLRGRRSAEGLDGGRSPRSRAARCSCSCAGASICCRSAISTAKSLGVDVACPALVPHRYGLVHRRRAGGRRAAYWLGRPSSAPHVRDACWSSPTHRRLLAGLGLAWLHCSSSASTIYAHAPCRPKSPSAC